MKIAVTLAFFFSFSLLGGVLAGLLILEAPPLVNISLIAACIVFAAVGVYGVKRIKRSEANGVQSGSYA